MSVEFVESRAAAACISDGDTVVIQSLGTISIPEEILTSIENRFLETGHPKDLTLLCPGPAGDPSRKKVLGFDHFAYPGMVKRIITTTYALSMRMHDLVVNNEVEAYNFPLGTLYQWLREIGAGKPGLITKVGIGTKVDPRYGGGKLNEKTKEDLVKLITLDGEEYLWYKPININVAILRGTTSDEEGNITMESEPNLGGAKASAMAVKKNKGTVIVQVLRLSKAGLLNPKTVILPSILVDKIVVSREPEKYHRQTARFYYNPMVSGEINSPVYFDKSKPLEFDRVVRLPNFLVYGKLKLTPKKIIGKRASLEIKKGDIVAFGWGTSEYAAYVAQEDGIHQNATFTVESGCIGGILPIGNFNIQLNPKAMVDPTDISEYYNGIGVDVGFLGFGQVDCKGRVNVSKLGTRLFGLGGFMDIIHGARKVVFCGTFTPNVKIELENNKLKIIEEGKHKRFVKAVDTIDFNPEYLKDPKVVLYITERCVFELTSKNELMLTEVAPGVDLKKDILDKMDFHPKLDPDLKEMPREIFES
ncbi:hypothetical protein DRP07_03740 [Archaeoglobales archaeon]|nr:MAG: hypothetical protein DRP07_03740 [Archaeoglobales archaeon]